VIEANVILARKISGIIREQSWIKQRCAILLIRDLIVATESGGKILSIVVWELSLERAAVEEIDWARCNPISPGFR